jgi:hypothetical protein
MRKLYLNGEEYELKSGDVLVLINDKVCLYGFRAVDPKGYIQKLTFTPNGDDKAIVSLRFFPPKAYASFMAELLGFALAEEHHRTSDTIYFHLYK